jgi:hypothetical protein
MLGRYIIHKNEDLGSDRLQKVGEILEGRMPFDILEVRLERAPSFPSSEWYENATENDERVDRNLAFAWTFGLKYTVLNGEISELPSEHKIAKLTKDFKERVPGGEQTFDRELDRQIGLILSYVAGLYDGLQMTLQKDASSMPEIVTTNLVDHLKEKSDSPIAYLKTIKQQSCPQP